MDSMSADLMRGLETSLPTFFYFDRERFSALLVSGDMDGARNYLSEFTKFDSNYHSNLMFYLVQRQRFCKLLVQRDLMEAVFVMVLGQGHEPLRHIGMPETKKDFIDNDLKRLESLCLKVSDSCQKGYTFDVVPYVNAVTNEMFQMMNYLVAMNPDLQQKKDISSQMQTTNLCVPTTEK